MAVLIFVVIGDSGSQVDDWLIVDDCCTAFRQLSLFSCCLSALFIAKLGCAVGEFGSIFLDACGILTMMPLLMLLLLLVYPMN